MTKSAWAKKKKRMNDDGILKTKMRKNKNEGGRGMGDTRLSSRCPNQRSHKRVEHGGMQKNKINKISHLKEEYIRNIKTYTPRREELEGDATEWYDRTGHSGELPFTFAF